MSTALERKLTTILAADVAGYSRLMAADEVAAMAMLQDCRGIFARFIERHRGRIANTAGDGLLAEFPSVVEAVQCAVEVQRELDARSRERDAAHAMRFRIGLHLGDVMVENGDLFGESVNLAARLQSMAEPGGVLISQAVYDQVRTKLAIGYEYLGERQPKNLAERVPVYRLVLGGAAQVGQRTVGTGRDDAANAAGHGQEESAAAGRGSEATPTVSTDGLRRRVIRHAKALGIVWSALATINVATGDTFWALWPGIAFAAVLGLESAPLLARGRIDPLLVRLIVAVAALAAINLTTWSGGLWFLWPAGALTVLYALRRVLWA